MRKLAPTGRGTKPPPDRDPKQASDPPGSNLTFSPAPRRPPALPPGGRRTSGGPGQGRQGHGLGHATGRPPINGRHGRFGLERAEAGQRWHDEGAAGAQHRGGLACRTPTNSTTCPMAGSRRRLGELSEGELLERGHGAGRSREQEVDAPDLRPGNRTDRSLLVAWFGSALAWAAIRALEPRADGLLWAAVNPAWSVSLFGPFVRRWGDGQPAAATIS